MSDAELAKELAGRGLDVTVPNVARIYDYFLGVILSFRVSRGCDLRRPVVDSVLDGTAAA